MTGCAVFESFALPHSSFDEKWEVDGPNGIDGITFFRAECLEIG